MSCYTRHLDDLLPANPSQADRRALDERVRAALGMADADCSEVREAVNLRRAEAGFDVSVQAHGAGGGHMAPAKTRHDGVGG